MANKKLSGPDYLLLLLYVDNKKPIVGAIRLMKMMFLFEKEVADILKSKGLDSEKLPEFFAYDYGAFSSEVYDQIELFKGIDFVKVQNIIAKEEMIEVDDLEDEPFIHEMYSQDKGLHRFAQPNADATNFLEQSERQVDGKCYKYEIGNNGIAFIEQEIIGKKQISDAQMQILEQFKKKINSLSPKQILRYTYTKYPEYTVKSLIKDEVLGDE